MKILFENGTQVSIELIDSPLRDIILSIYKHLQHVPVPFRAWDNPFYLTNQTYGELVDKLINYGKLVNVTVDQQKCLDQSQDYFNYLHKIYEVSYNGNAQWLDYHEHIHMCEKYYSTDNSVIMSLDYREKSGLLEKQFNYDWLSSSTTNLSAGDVWIEWAELGKTPYSYWKNNEPNDISRIQELAKPWLKLRPKLQIALNDYDSLRDKNIEEFNNWWRDYREPWCAHWGIPNWTIDDMFACTKIGTTDSKLITELLNNQHYPSKVQL